MIQHDLIQGTDEWSSFRLSHFGASEAAAMLGISRKVKRTELLRAKSTGIAREFSDWVQKNVLDYGHDVEALARPIVEEMLGIELFPITCSEGKLSASCDGLSMCETIAWENKQFNQAYFDMVMQGELPEEHWPQCQQVLHVTGAERLYFTISDGTIEGTVGMWVYPDADKINQILAGWNQFEKDLESYTPEPEYIPAKAEPVMALPALSIQVGGSISIQSNLDRFGERLKSFISETNAKPETDQDFANLEQACKVLKEAEDALKQAESNALAQTASVDEMRRTVAFLADMARTNRLQFEKLVKSEKENRKAQIVDSARLAFESHCREIQADLPVLFINKHVIFAEAIKGKKTISSMQDAVNTMLANAKIEADALARDLREKHNWYIDNGAEHSFLFSDLQNIIYKPSDDFQAVVNNRISQHKEQERIKAEQAAKAQAEREARIAAEAEEKARKEAEAKAEADRERIRQEEAAKLRAEQDRKVIAEAIENRVEIEKKTYKQTDIETISEKPDPLKIEDPIERLIASLVLRIESGDMTIRDALMVAYQAGTERAVAA
jgi:predicted phage-related endonuclease